MHCGGATTSSKHAFSEFSWLHNFHSHNLNISATDISCLNNNNKKTTTYIIIYILHVHAHMHAHNFNKANIPEYMIICIMKKNVKQLNLNPSQSFYTINFTIHVYFCTWRPHLDWTHLHCTLTPSVCGVCWFICIAGNPNNFSSGLVMEYFLTRVMEWNVKYRGPDFTRVNLTTTFDCIW